MNVVFICTGNTCRSPMAEGYLKSLKLENVNVFSAGLSANGETVSKNSQIVMEEMGIDISAHISTPLTVELIQKADIIYTMTATHKAILENAIKSFDGLSARIENLDSEDISDPFMSDVNAYRECRDQIVNAINYRFGIKKRIVEDLYEDDIYQIAELERLCFEHPWSEKSIGESMANRTHFLGIKENGVLIGYLSYRMMCGMGDINNIATHPDYRRQGIARQLLCILVATGIFCDYTALDLEVRESNIPAKNLYSAFGFKENGRRKNYYDAPKEDAILMRRRFL
ncbi:MAG: ribosomal protein S18-alanine N-acetyltransferase [Acutalibacteraceae bacterium]|nr:ribosomal protein S18-alanine N-acetyltransferase [Acutalibacteraceae bacterium]